MNAALYDNLLISAEQRGGSGIGPHSQWRRAGQRGGTGEDDREQQGKVVLTGAIPKNR